MTITYDITECQREIEGYLKRSKNSHMEGWLPYIEQMIEVWALRFVQARERAILINREIICQWEAVKLIDVIMQGHNPYMAVAALRLLVEDFPRISDHDIGCIILFSNPLHARFDIWNEINILEGELDSRREQRYCPDCDCRRIDCDCEDETPAQAAGFRQSDFI